MNGPLDRKIAVISLYYYTQIKPKLWSRTEIIWQQQRGHTHWRTVHIAAFQQISSDININIILFFWTRCLKWLVAPFKFILYYVVLWWGIAISEIQTHLGGHRYLISKQKYMLILLRRLKVKILIIFDPPQTMNWSLADSSKFCPIPLNSGRFF